MNSGDLSLRRTQTEDGLTAINWFLSSGGFVGRSICTTTLPERWEHQDQNCNVLGYSSRWARGYNHFDSDGAFIDSTNDLESFIGFCDFAVAEQIKPTEEPATTKNSGVQDCAQMEAVDEETYTLPSSVVLVSIYKTAIFAQVGLVAAFLILVASIMTNPRSGEEIADRIRDINSSGTRSLSQDRVQSIGLPSPKVQEPQLESRHVEPVRTADSHSSSIEQSPTPLQQAWLPNAGPSETKSSSDRVQPSTNVARLEASPQQSPASTEIPKTAPAPVPPLPTKDTLADKLKAFVVAHHRYASTGNLKNLVNDYDENAFYIDRLKTHQEILDEEKEYHRHWEKVQETVGSSINISGSEGLYTLRYSVSFRTESTSQNRWVTGTNNIVLQVADNTGVFAITNQTAQISDRHEGRLSSVSQSPAPPTSEMHFAATAAPIAVKKPYWVAILRDRNAPNVDTTDAIHFERGVAYWHRTFRIFSDDGVVLSWCRAEYRGPFNRHGNQIEVLLEQVGWAPGSDINYIRLVDAGVESIVGKSVFYKLSGDDLTTHLSGSIELLHPVQ